MKREHVMKKQNMVRCRAERRQEDEEAKEEEEISWIHNGTKGLARSSPPLFGGTAIIVFDLMTRIITRMPHKLTVKIALLCTSFNPAGINTTSAGVLASTEAQGTSGFATVATAPARSSSSATSSPTTSSATCIECKRERVEKSKKYKKVRIIIIIIRKKYERKGSSNMNMKKMMKMDDEEEGEEDVARRWG